MVIVSLNLAATNYYVSSSTGNDGNNGTSQSTPWRTLTKVNAALLNPGDIVNLMKGDTFIGTIIVNRSGSVGNPIKYMSYGTGAAPIISGFVSVTSWVNLGGNIWESSAAVSTANDCNMVVINGVNTPMGRYPNTGWLTVNGHTNIPAATIISSGINSSVTNWTGADFYTKTWAFAGQRNRITAHSGTTITYTATTADNAQNGYGFFIENDPKTLDVAGEWYYNPTTKKIRIYNTVMPTGVRVTTLDTLAYMSGKSNITFDGISFIGSNKRTFFVQSCTNVTVQNCNLDFNGLYAVWGGSNGGSNSTNFNFNHNTVNHSNQISIILQNQFVNPYIGYNVIKNSGIIHGACKLLDKWDGACDGLYFVNNNGLTVEYNRIDSVGYCGVHYTAGNNALVQYNEITNYCSNLQDGGGIYAWTGPNTRPATTGLIQYNIVHDGLSANDGIATPSPQTSSIYLDEHTGNTQVRNNTGANNDLAGGFDNSDTACLWSNNTFYNNGTMQMYFNSKFRSKLGYDTNKLTGLYNNVARSNIFFSLASTQLCARFTSKFNDIKTTFFTSLDSNYYARPIDDNQSIRVVFNNDSVNVLYNLAQWKTYIGSPFDVHSNKSPITITNVNQVFFTYNATVAPVVKSIPAGTWIDVRGVSYNTGSTTLQPYTSLILINTGTNLAPIANAGTNKNITLPTTSVTQIGTGSDPDGSITSYSWSQFSGPATVTFGSATSPATTVNGMTVAGVYVVRLTVTDNFGLTGTDTASIIVNASPPTNIPPTANAGGNKIITLPTSTVTQVGSGTDPDGSIVSYLWTKISGPSTFNIVSPTSSTTVINGLITPGNYGFMLTVTDNLGLTGTATCTITVNTPFPTPPTANAGPNQTITYPTNTVTLTGSGTDADGTIVAYNWVKVAGGVATITNANSASTTVTGLFVGVYQFQLTVTDNSGATGKDTVQITVNQGTSSISFSGPTLTTFWTGLPQQPTVITTPAGLSYSITFNNVGNIPVDTGTYVVRVATTDPGYTSSFAQANFRINPAPATISVGNQIQQYDSLLKNVTVTTNPAGLAYIITGAPQRYIGTYNITVTLNDPHHTATPVNTTLTITAGQTTLSWNPADLTYPAVTGAAQTNATSPKNGVFTYTPASGTLLNAGPQQLSLLFVPSDTNLAPISVQKDITVFKGVTSISVVDTIQDFDGTVKNVTATAGESGTVSVTYTGGHTAVGDYPYTAHFTSANWTAPDVSGTLHILSNVAAINITNYSNLPYTGSPISPTVTSLYSYTLTFNGSASVPTLVGSYITIAHINDGVHTGDDTVTMTIIKANPPYNWPAISPITNPTPLSGTQLNINSSIPVSVSYNPISGTVLGAGSHVLSATITPTDGANYNTITVTNTITVNTGGAVINVSNPPQTYNGLPHPIVATTTPPNLDSLDIVYGLTPTHTPPTNAGSYPFTVTLINPNVVASPVSGTLVISKGTYSLTWTTPNPIQQNAMITASILNPSSTIAGFFTFNYTINTLMGSAGTFALQATFHPTDSVNYDVQTITVPLVVYGTPFVDWFIGTYFENLPGQIFPQ